MSILGVSDSTGPTPRRRRRRFYSLACAPLSTGPSPTAAISNSKQINLAARTIGVGSSPTATDSLLLSTQNLAQLAGAQDLSLKAMAGGITDLSMRELAAAKGMSRGGICVADYHANLIYNQGAGSAAEVRSLIEELKTRVRDRFGLELEEEVQYIG